MVSRASWQPLARTIKGLRKGAGKFRSWCLFNRRYFGFRLPYFDSPAYRRLPHGTYWEPQLTASLLREIGALNCSRPAVMDVGANIGLLSLNILSAWPEAKIYAFEPGPLQRGVLERIKKFNHIPGLTIYATALADYEGVAAFSSHGDVDASGLDGLQDTKLGGPTRRLEVAVSTADKWWRANNCPTIHLIKVDVEGAELLVLRGAAELIRTCKPMLFIEIWPNHIANYPYGEEDLLSWLAREQYELVTLGDQRIVKDSSELNREDPSASNYLARPMHSAC